MKIKRSKEAEHTKYMHVPAGDVFTFTDATCETYIKIAVNVQNGERQHFHDSTLVHHLPNAFLTLE